MERLTEEKQLGPFASLKDKAEAVPGAFSTYECLYSHMVAVTRLKEYEDTGLEPKEIAEVQEAIAQIPFGRFRDIVEAERTGRLVVLPCKIGDKLYSAGYYEREVREFEVSRTFISEGKIGVFAALCTAPGKLSTSLEYFTDKSIGKSVFLTREEAEAAIAKRGDYS